MSNIISITKPTYLDSGNMFNLVRITYVLKYPKTLQGVSDPTDSKISHFQMDG